MGELLKGIVNSRYETDVLPVSQVEKGCVMIA